MTQLSLETTRGLASASVTGTDAYHLLKDVGKTFSGTTLRLLTADTPGGKAAWELVQEEFIPLTGIAVEWDILPLDRVLGRIEQDIARGAGTYDIMYWAHGGSVYYADGTLAIHDEPAYAALEYLLAWRQSAPPESSTWDWSGEAEAFCQGRVGMFISSGEWFPWLDDSLGSRVSGRVATAPCPQEIALRSASECGCGEVPGISRQGGSSLARSRYSQHPEAAWVFLQWLTSADTMARSAVLSQTNGVCRSVYRDPRVTAWSGANSWRANYIDVTLDAIENRMGTEPHLPNWIDLGLERFPVELGKLMTDQQSIKTTLDNMAQAAARATETL